MNTLSVNPQHNVAVMGSANEGFQKFKASEGNIFSPNFPEPVPEISLLTSCTLSSRCSSIIFKLIDSSISLGNNDYDKKSLHNKKGSQSFHHMLKTTT